MSIHIAPEARQCWSIEVCARMLGVAEQKVISLVESGWLHWVRLAGVEHYGKIDADEVRAKLREGWTPRAAVPVPLPVAEPVDMSREAMAARYEAAAGRRRRKTA